MATAEVVLSWNQIFRAIGPALMNEASETSMKERLGWAAGAALTEAGGWPDGVALPESLEVDADPEALDQVKVQFRALNLIEKGIARRAPSDKSVYWRLTERGEVHLAQLMAIRR